MENDPLDQSLKAHLGGDAPAEVHTRASTHFNDLAASLAKHAATAKRPRRPLLWFWAGAGLSGTLALAALAVAFLFSPAPSWAQVAERFRNLKFFNATVFFTSNVGQSPEKIDLWVAQDHRLRAHYRGLIFFGAEGQIKKVVSAVNGQDIPVADLQAYLRFREGAGDPYPALTLVQGIARLGEMREFSLDNLLQLLSSKRDLLHATANSEEKLGDDMQVFDLAARNRPEWMRLWVLRKSQLPVRLRMWDPSDGSQTELLFDYANEMPADAFDAGLVKTALLEKQGTPNRLYALLKDSGGHPLSPEQLFAAHGYHLPEIDTVGRTPEGIVWVLSRNVENRRPDGESLYGWSTLSDNLGQTYTRRVMSWRADDGILVEYYVPADLGPNFRLPANYTLACVDEPGSSVLSNTRGAKTIGSISITNWRETTSIPDLIAAQRNQINGRTHWGLAEMDTAAERRDWKRFDELAASIAGEPENDAAALRRDVKVAHKLVLTQDLANAATLTRRLFPLVTRSHTDTPPLAANIVRWYIADLYRAGQLDQARMLANKHAAEVIGRSHGEGSQFVTTLLEDLRTIGLPEAETKTFFNRQIVDALESLQPARPSPVASRVHL